MHIRSYTYLIWKYPILLVHGALCEASSLEFRLIGFDRSLQCTRLVNLKSSETFHEVNLSQETSACSYDFCPGSWPFKPRQTACYGAAQVLRKRQRLRQQLRQRLLLKLLKWKSRCGKCGEQMGQPRINVHQNYKLWIMDKRCNDGGRLVFHGASMEECTGWK